MNEWMNIEAQFKYGGKIQKTLLHAFVCFLRVSVKFLNFVQSWRLLSMLAFVPYPDLTGRYGSSYGPNTGRNIPRSFPFHFSKSITKLKAGIQSFWLWIIIFSMVLTELKQGIVTLKEASDPVESTVLPPEAVRPSGEHQPRKRQLYWSHGASTGSSLTIQK